MGLKQKLMSISLAASTLLGAGIVAHEQSAVPEKQPAAAQPVPQPEGALTPEQQTAMLKKLTALRRRMERSCKAEILKMERMEARKVTQAQRVYQNAVRKADRVMAKGALSTTDEVVLKANIDQARENAELYEKTIDETIKQQSADIQKRYNEELKAIDRMIRDVEKGKMPKIRQPEPKEKMPSEKYRIQRAVGNER